MGTEAFAERARRELLHHWRDRAAEKGGQHSDSLTPQELEVARLAHDVTPTK